MPDFLRKANPFPMHNRKVEQNPLSIAFGAYLRHRRGRGPVEDIARKLDISASFYRMIEAGTANLHIGKTFLLIRALDTGRAINLDALCKFISALQFIESHMEDDRHMYIALKIIADSDHRLMGIIDVLRPLTDMVVDRNLERVKEYINRSNFLNELERYFTDELFGLEGPEHLKEQFLNSKALQVSQIVRLVEAFGSLHTRVHYLDLWNWEERHLSDIRKYYLLIDDKNNLLSQENLKDYHFNFLWEPDFEEMRILVIEKELTDDQLKNEFKLGLQTWSKLSIERRSEIEKVFQKVHFHTIKDLPNEAYRNPLISDDVVAKRWKVQYNAFWAFELTDNRLVGFVGKVRADDAKIQEALILSVKESIQKTTLFNELFN